LLVLAFHGFPARLTGGYVGVDVFFAISGFLITGHLVRSIAEKKKSVIRDFYLRRVRRLLPAALVTLLVVAVATVVFCPPTVWQEFSRQILSSTFFVENWSLANNAADYLAMNAGASPVENFWSLSVEEQFYLVLPLVLIAGGLFAVRRRLRLNPVLLTLVGAISVISFVFSIVVTTADPAWAYFATPTRAWEFGLGGVLALALNSRSLPAAPSPPARAILSWAGIAAIASSAIFFTGLTPIPGFLALVPVAGALAIIFAGPQSKRYSPAFVMNLKIVQRIGDASYSIYLWHWPLLILAPIVFSGYGSSLNKWGTMGVLGLSLVIGFLSKKYVEDPFRHVTNGGGRHLPRFGPRPFFLAVSTFVAIIVLISGVLGVQSSAMIAEAQAASATFRVADHPCFGAASMAEKTPACAASNETLDPLLIVPSPIVGTLDRPISECLQGSGKSDVIVCHLGETENIFQRVAIVGDSHAKQWFPALEILAKEHGWAIDTYLKAGCAYSRAETKNAACNGWNENVARMVPEENYDRIFVGALSTILPLGKQGLSPVESAVKGYQSAWKPLLRDGSDVFVFTDIPKPFVAGIPDAPSCLIAHGPAGCIFSRTAGLPEDPLAEAGRSLNGVHVIDLADYFCTGDVCATVIGNALVYSDGGHVSMTYSRTLAPMLDHALDAFTHN